MIMRLQQIEAGEWRVGDVDWRTQAGVLWRMLEYATRPYLREALTGLLECGRKDLSNPKYDGYFDTARAAIAKAEGR